jgi:hypothetical protein
LFEVFSRDFSDEKEIHSTPTSSCEHANRVGDRFPQLVRSSWFGGLLCWRARTSCHFERNACTNSHPVSTFCAGAHPSAPVRWIGFDTAWCDIKAVIQSLHAYEIRPLKDKRGVDLRRIALESFLVAG